MPTKEVKAHQVYKQIGSASTILNFDSLSDLTEGDGWEVVWNTFPYLINRSYIDLAGWSKQALTTFVRGVDFQHERRPRSSNIGILEVTTVDILSTRRLTDEELTNWGSDIPSLSKDIPGFADSTVDLMEVIYGERITYVSNSTMAVGLAGSVYVTLGASTFGSGNPVSTDKLHYTRVVWINGIGPAESITFGSTNLVTQATTMKEDELVWMERLRRSYVLQDQADV